MDEQFYTMEIFDNGLYLMSTSEEQSPCSAYFHLR